LYDMLSLFGPPCRLFLDRF